MLGLAWVLLAAPVFPLVPFAAQGETPHHAAGMQSPVPALEPAPRLGAVNVGAAPLRFSSSSFRHSFAARPQGRVWEFAPVSTNRTLLILLQRWQLEGG